MFPLLAPSTPLASQHQRPELILCEAGPASPPSGITCLTLARGSDAPRTIRERQQNTDGESVILPFANYVSCTARVEKRKFCTMRFPFTTSEGS